MKIPFSEVLADETKNGTKLKTSDYQTRGTYPIIDQGQDFIAGYTDSENGLYSDVPAIVFGDHTRILKYVDFPFFLGADGAKILKARANHANYKYLYYALKSVRIPDTGYNRHFKWLKEATVSIPDSRKQESIVYTLDAISRIIAHRQSQLAKLDELVKCRFVELFGNPVTNPKSWQREKLADIGELARGISKFRPRNAPFLLNGPYPLIQTGDISNAGTYITSYTSSYSEEGLKQSKLWPSGTLVITIAANIAETSILTFPACFPDSVVGFIANENRVSSLFIHYWFSFFQQKLEHDAPQVAQKNINLKILSELLVIVPPLEIQHSFVAFIHRIDKLRFVIRQSLDETQKLFDSLMQEYFE